MADNNSRYSKEYLQEAETRLKEMEDSNYEFPVTFSKTDWILAITTIVVSGLLLVGGYWM